MPTIIQKWSRRMLFIDWGRRILEFSNLSGDYGSLDKKSKGIWLSFRLYAIQEKV